MTPAAREAVLRTHRRRQRRPEGLQRRLLSHADRRATCSRCSIRCAGWRGDSARWLEITNLVIPRANDSPEEIERMCRWIADELGPDVPLHFSAFHPRFQADRPRADAAGDAGRGLRHRPALRPALRLHRQRQRPPPPDHLLPRLRPGGDRAATATSWASIASARAAARSAARRSPAGWTIGRAIGAAAACRSASATMRPQATARRAAAAANTLDRPARPQRSRTGECLRAAGTG